MRNQTHPALELFKRLFDEASQDPGPYSVTYFVPRSAFIDECKKAGIGPAVDDVISWFDWEESIGLPEFAHKIFARYHKEHGTDFTPMEKGAWRLRKKQLKSEQ